MGWASGTGIFDAVVDVTIELVDPDNANLIQEIVREMYTAVDWNDWDTQDESKYFQPYLLEVMHDLGEIDDEYYESVTKQEE